MELLDGEYVVAPSPSERHQTAVVNICTLLKVFLQANPLGRVFVAPFDVYLSESDVLQPDLLVVLQAHASRIQADGIHGTPDLVIEVGSPGTASTDLTLKKEIYARAGVPEYWFVDPGHRTVAVYRLTEQAERRVFQAVETLQSALLPGLSLKVSDFFAP